MTSINLIHIKSQGQPCKQGETQEQTGCIPAAKISGRNSKRSIKPNKKRPFSGPPSSVDQAQWVMDNRRDHHNVSASDIVKAHEILWEAKNPPQPKPKPKPVVKSPNTLSPAAEKTLANLVSDLNNSSGLSDEQKKTYTNALRRVVQKIPDKAHELISNHLKGSYFYPDTESLGGGVYDRILEHRPKWLKFLGKIFASKEIGRLEKKLFVLSHNGMVACFFKGALHLDGGTAIVKFMNKFGLDSVSCVYAHEITHAIDGDRSLSNDDEWKSAWQEEIVVEHNPLSFYAKTDESEGLAEFGRALYGSGVDLLEVEKKFPKSTKFFKDKGLWPNN